MGSDPQEYLQAMHNEEHKECRAVIEELERIINHQPHPRTTDERYQTKPLCLYCNLKPDIDKVMGREEK